MHTTTTLRQTARLLPNRNLPLGKLVSTLCFFLAGIFFLQARVIAQTSTCSGATVLTAVNAISCTPGTSFDVSNNSTGVAYSSCATGRSNPGNAWGQFVANGPTATITYTPDTRDAMIFAYSGTCGGTLTQIGCVDDYGNRGTETLSLSGLTAGSTYYVRIVRYNSTGSMTGNICVASPNSNAISTGTISGSPFCEGSSVSVPFTSTGSFSSNTYTAQLSDAAGSFASPVTIGTLVSNANSGTISATLPVIAAGSGYRIRVISSNPAVTGSANTTDLTINSLPQGSFSGNTVCGLGTGQLTFTATSGTGPFDIVYNDGLFNRTKNNVTSGVGYTPTPPTVITKTYTLVTVTDNNGCVRSTGFTSSSATITFTTSPTIASSSSAADVCSSTTAQGSTLSYALTTGAPTQYSITWDAAALSAGLVNTGNIPITSSPLDIPVAANVAAATYNGTVTVYNAGGCASGGNPFTLTINQTPSITAAAAASTKCFNAAYHSASLSYTSTTGSPTNYSVAWDATALSAGFANIGSTPLSGSPIALGIPGGITGGTYTGYLTVTNSLGCSSTPVSFTHTIVDLPTITASTTAQTRCYNAGAQNSSISYTSVSPSATKYSITWDAAAQSAGLVNLAFTNITSSPLIIPVAAGVPAGTYNGSLKVMTSNGCQSAAAGSFTFTITGATGPVMTSPSAAVVCNGSTVSIPLTSDIAATYTWIATDNVNVTGESTSLQTSSTLNNTLSSVSAGSEIVNYTVTPTSTGGCIGTPQTVAVTVSPLPGITSASSTAARCFSATAQTTTLSYSATTNSPNRYSIVWNAAALSAGLVNVSNASLPASQITISIPAGVVSNTYNGTLTVTTAGGCVSAGNAFTLTISAPPTITTQPVSQSVCSGSSVSFSVVASGTGLTYQWRKGTTNLCNCGTASGVTSATLTINPAAAGDAATNYNCVITKSGCSSVTSDYVSLTVNSASTAPTVQPKDLVFPTVGITSILASFTPSVDATRYLVIRKTTNVAPTNPSNGTLYTQGSTALTGYIEYSGPNISFTSNGLSPGTTYYYWVFGYNESACGTTPLYLTTAPLTGNVTTATNIACGTVTTLYWGGKGSGLSGATSGTDFNTAANWSTSGSSYVASPAVPSQCNNISLDLRSAAALKLSSSAEVYNLTLTVSGNGVVAGLSTENNLLTVYGDAHVEVISGNSSTAVYIGENGSGAGIVDFKANFKLGETYFASVYPASYLVGNVNSKIIFRGDVLLGRTSRINLPASSGYPPSYPLATPGNGTTPGTVEFDGDGVQQVLWNNNVYYDCFYNIVVGNQNKPYVKHVTGTYTPDNILNNLTINDGCTVDIGTSQWIRERQGGTFTMNGTAKLMLGNNYSVKSAANTGIPVTGSNFPGGFSTMNISSGSTIEYNAGNSLTQTVYGTPSVGSLTYGNLTVSNGDGSGTSNKISTSTINAAGTITISDKTVMTPGAGIVSDGDMYVNNGGQLICGTNNITGGGSFNLLDGGTISIGSTGGIAATATSGNIRTSGRYFATGANYIYAGSSAQATGDGLPTTVNNLTITNNAGVTMYAASANYTVTGILNLSAGAFGINGNTLTINNLQRSSGTLTGSSSSSVTINGSSIPLFFTSGGRILKDITLSDNASADLQTTLDITGGSSAGAVTVGNNATLNTFGFLTLKSDANGTARVAPIPEDGSGNALGSITGTVQVERYLPAKRGWRMMAIPIQASGAPTINTAFQEGAVNYDYVYANNQNPNPGYGIHISGSSPSLGFDATPLNNPSMMVFNKTTGLWGGVPNTNTVKVTDYQGYMIFVRGSRSTNLSQNTGAALSNTVTRGLGTLRTGKQTISLPTGAGSRYSVVGNPFASTIDFRTFTVSGPVSTKNYVLWDPALTGAFGVGAYQYFTRSGGPGSDYLVFPGGGSYGAAGSVNNYIQSGQAFMIQNTGAGDLIIDESAKVSPSTSLVFRPMPGYTVGKISTILWSVDNDSTSTLLDGALMMYGNEFSDSIELEDAAKMFNTTENFGISKGTAVYQIEKRQSLNETDTIQYNIRTMKVKNYKLAIELQNIETVGLTAFLKDKYTSQETVLNMNSTTDYPFSVTADAASKAADRFSIYFRQLSVLPVTFTAVNATRQEAQGLLTWKVQNEMNIASYDIERSANGTGFSKLGSITEIANNNNSSNYQWIDGAPLRGMNYYRIKSIGSNGKTQYSSVVKLNFGKDAGGINVFPNPVVDGTINIIFEGQQAGTYTANLFNNSGQLIKSTRIIQAGANKNVQLHLDNNLPHGNYILEIKKPGNTSTHINIVY